MNPRQFYCLRGFIFKLMTLLEFEGFKKRAGANAFTMSPKKWIEATDAIGIVSKAGRYGGTYAHSDIAMSFATWISPEFQLYIMKLPVYFK